MPYVPFVGPSYVYRTTNYDAQRSINLYPAKSEGVLSKTQSILVGTPGLQTALTLPETSIKGIYSCRGRLFAVAGSSFYELNADLTYTNRGACTFSNPIVSISDNGLEVCVVGGNNGYIFNLSTNVFTKITAGGFQGADTITFLDGYFIVNHPGTNQYYISDLYDGLAWDILDFGSFASSANLIVGVHALHQNVWVFGTEAVEIEYNSGDGNFPFQRVQGAYIEYGCVAAQSITSAANTIFWLTQDKNGQGMVMMANGYQPQRISTQAIEFAIQKYSDLSTANGYCYQEEGHFFYVLNFPNGTSSLVYDVTMESWHERCDLDINGFFTRHVGMGHAFCFNNHVVPDYKNGNIYKQNLNLYDYAGILIKRQRVMPHMVNNLDNMLYHWFQLDMEVGIGLDGTIVQPNYDPQVMLQWSNDGGHKYSYEYWRSAGKIGETRKRVVWRQLGRSRDRIFKLSIVANTKVYLLGAVVKADPCSS